VNVIVELTSNKHKNISKAKIRVKARRIKKLNKKERPLSGPDRILLEESWTDFLLAIIEFGNRHVMRSLKYCLKEEADIDELEESEREGLV
jgi:hypothetical protein